jgi:hypothetical protein
MPFARQPFYLLLITSTAALGLASGAARALSTDDLLKSAQAACLQSAAKAGWQTDTAKVVSSKPIDADKVEVVLDLTKDGANSARLTCPYSASKGVLGALDATKNVVATLEGSKTPGSEKESPYSAAKDEEGTGEKKGAIKKLEGTSAPGTEKESPYAAAKDDFSISPAALGQLWGLLLPVGLAVGSYLFLKGRENNRPNDA